MVKNANWDYYPKVEPYLWRKFLSRGFFFMNAVMNPIVKDCGEIGGKFMQYLNVHSKMATTMDAAAILTFLSEFTKYWWLSGFAI